MYQRIHLDDMGTPKSYERWGKDYCLEFVEFVDMTDNLALHYGAVRYDQSVFRLVFLGAISCASKASNVEHAQARARYLIFNVIHSYGV